MDKVERKREAAAEILKETPGPMKTADDCAEAIRGLNAACELCDGVTYDDVDPEAAPMLSPAVANLRRAAHGTAASDGLDTLADEALKVDVTRWGIEEGREEASKVEAPFPIACERRINLEDPDVQGNHGTPLERVEGIPARQAGIERKDARRAIRRAHQGRGRARRGHGG